MDTLPSDLASTFLSPAPPRLTTAQRTAIITSAETFVKTAFASHDPSHDYHHINRVRLLALSLTQSPDILDSPPLDLLVVELGALFHDLTDSKYNSSSSTPNAVLAPFWSTLSPPDIVTASQRQLVEKIVGNVSWSKDERRRAQSASHLSAIDIELNEWLSSCVEFHCVSDADRLDSIGSIGILRCAAYSAKINRPLYIPPNNPQNDPVPPAEQSEGYNGSAVAHFYEKLLKIRGDRLYTQRAREEADRRQGMMRGFLDELSLEWLVASQGCELVRLQQEEEELQHEEAEQFAFQ
ncbi:hypothetical protein PHSY_005158 [Pseudozyma hubeiensis SY62]|uniref:HD/PDEase domain-containing protein n=1 Tax=Pseudozyma hubeiensis (strain SY62) TaxID=1305764 RepID=R9P8I6_PSEHS|nr:hypothetical protein PHSY_005158 [Pseudozyma hubeiensis SY62]GAC97572.1 hypothetical protein PHSY_005158 [Pseudozyma hubeiensis SY62]